MNSPAADPIAQLDVAGLGVWAPGLADWAAMRDWLRGRLPDPVESTPPRPPAATLLPPAERRRAPVTVSLALHVAQAACRSAALDPAALPSVFSCSGGDLEITDYLCTVLAQDPAHLSPTRFHHSVHNAAGGYWTIATGCQAASIALAAGAHSFAAGLLDAALLAQADQRPVLYVAYDMPARGALADVTTNRALFATALVLRPAAPDAADRSGSFGRLGLRLEPGSLPGTGATPGMAPLRPAAAEMAAHTPAARGLHLLDALAGNRPGPLRLAAGPGLILNLQVNPGPMVDAVPDAG